MILRTQCLLAVTAIFALCGCITSGDEPVAKSEEGEVKRRTTLERAQDSVTKRIDRMKYQNGKALLGTLQELIAYKELAKEPILAAFPNADDRTRANLLYVLGYLGGQEAHQLAVQSLQHKDAVVRYEASASLMAMGDWSAVPVLLKFMEAKDRRLRYKSFQVLSKATSQELGYNFDAQVPAREAALSRWHSWWEDRREEIIYGRK